MNNIQLLDTPYTCLAYVATMVALSTHTHPIQALQYAFSEESNIEDATDIESAIIVAHKIIEDHNLPLFGEVGDLSEDPKLIMYLDSLASAIGEAWEDSEMALNEFNNKFDKLHLWEGIACVGKAWVANGIGWTKATILSQIR